MTLGEAVQAMESREPGYRMRVPSGAVELLLRVAYWLSLPVGADPITVRETGHSRDGSVEVVVDYATSDDVQMMIEAFDEAGRIEKERAAVLAEFLKRLREGSVDWSPIQI